MIRKTIFAVAVASLVALSGLGSTAPAQGVTRQLNSTKTSRNQARVQKPRLDLDTLRGSLKKKERIVIKPRPISKLRGK